jgi:hypothetical protein
MICNLQVREHRSREVVKTFSCPVVSNRSPVALIELSGGIFAQRV